MSIGQNSSSVNSRHVVIGADGVRVGDAGIIIIGIIGISLGISHRRGEGCRDRRNAPWGALTLLGARARRRGSDS